MHFVSGLRSKEHLKLLCSLILMGRSRSKRTKRNGANQVTTRTARTKAAKKTRSNARKNALVQRRTNAVPVPVPVPVPMPAVPVPMPAVPVPAAMPPLVAAPGGFEYNFGQRIEDANAALPQTNDSRLTYPLDVPSVRYRPPGYTVELEAMLYSPRDLILVTLPEPKNIFLMCDTDGRVLMRDYIAFYRSTATSITSKLPELKDTWFPTYGISPTYDIIKVTSLKTRRGFTLSWKPLLDVYVSMLLKINREADQRQNPYVHLFGIRSADPYELMKELGNRTASWFLLRISAAIGGGIWDIEPTFRQFVLDYTYVNREFVRQAFPLGLVKSPVFKTTQIYSETPLTPHEVALLQCRLAPEFQVTPTDGAAMVTYTETV